MAITPYLVVRVTVARAFAVVYNNWLSSVVEGWKASTQDYKVLLRFCLGRGTPTHREVLFESSKSDSSIDVDQLSRL